MQTPSPRATTLWQKVYPYCQLMRLDKPIGLELLLWPTAWALWFASDGIPPLKLLIIFFVGAFVMRAAGCIINDLTDRDLDGAVWRTSQRPLVTGAAKVSVAWLLFAGLSLIALYLVVQLGVRCLQIACVAMLLVIIYPRLKRYVYWPQAVLGIVFNAGVLMAFMAVQSHVSWQAWLIFFLAWMWTVAYDTAYAMADRQDDLSVGILSTAIWFGRYDRFVIAMLQTLMLLGLCALGLYNHLGWFYYSGLILAAILFVYQGLLIKDREREKCLKAFLNNHWVGFFIFIGLALNLWLK